MSDITYEASVYTRTVKYTNFKGQTSETKLFFALDPIRLMQVIAGFQPKKQVKSGNPSKRNEDVDFTDADQLKFVRDLASKAAGFPSEDGESWEPFENFADTIAGQAFMTKLASSDADRREFAETVIIAPFRAFKNFAEADPSNSQADVQAYGTMLAQLENVFTEKPKPDESLEDRRTRLAAEIAALDEKPSDS